MCSFYLCRDSFPYFMYVGILGSRFIHNIFATSETVRLSLRKKQINPKNFNLHHFTSWDISIVIWLEYYLQGLSSTISLAINILYFLMHNHIPSELSYSLLSGSSFQGRYSYSGLQIWLNISLSFIRSYIVCGLLLNGHPLQDHSCLAFTRGNIAS
jgi:hypothetical protein